MIDDLTLDEDHTGPKTSPAFYAFPAATPAELLIRERMHRFAGPGAGVIVFEDEDGRLENAERWRAIMTGWDRAPTVIEALAWRAWADGQALDAHWDDLVRARAAVP